MKIFAICIALLLAVQVIAQDEERDLFHLCSRFPDFISKEGEYCVTRTLTSFNPNILFFFHGIFGDANNWVEGKQHRKIRDHWRSIGFQPPIVITISLGKTFLLTPENGSSKSGKYELVAKKIIPYLEKVHFLKFGERHILSKSMGSFNSTQLILRNPRKWDRVALLCPPFTKVTPFSSKKKMEKFIRETGASKTKVKFSMALARTHYPSVENWNSDSPFEYAKREGVKDFPKTYVSVDQYDEYGFYPGGVEWIELLQAHGVEMVFDSLPKDHCSFDAARVGDFLAKRLLP